MNGNVQDQINNHFQQCRILFDNALKMSPNNFEYEVNKLECGSKFLDPDQIIEEGMRLLTSAYLTSQSDQYISRFSSLHFIIEKVEFCLFVCHGEASAQSTK